MKPLEFKLDLIGLAGLWPGGQAPRLFSIAPYKLAALYQSGEPNKNVKTLRKMERRTPREDYGSLISSLRMLLRYGDRIFPGFRCVYGEFVTEEWLALIDCHKDFHRDHVVHQAQVALVVKRLLTELTFPYDHPLVREWRDQSRVPENCEAPVTLLDLSAHVVARGGGAVRYLYDFAGEIGVPELLIKPNTLQAQSFWRGVIYDAAVAGALFHDIGYPLSFLEKIGGAIGKSGFRGMLLSGDVDAVWRLFDDPLCLMPFRGYRSARRVAMSHAFQKEAAADMAAALMQSHGLPGALTFLYLNHQIMDLTRSSGSSARGRLVMEMAALGMTMHDMGRIYFSGKTDVVGGGHAPRTPTRPHMRVSFQRDPVSFVMSLADELQSFGRFNSKFEHDGRGDPVLRYTQPIEQVRLESGGGTLKIVFGFKPASAFARLYTDDDENPKTMARCFDPNFGFIDYAPLFDKVELSTEWV